VALSTLVVGESLVKAEDTDCDKGPISNRAKKLPSSLNTSDMTFQSSNTKLESTSLSLAGSEYHAYDGTDRSVISMS
jgi:hypothetical protein